MELSRPFRANGVKLSTIVTFTNYRLIAQIREGERELLSISLDRKFIENNQNRGRLFAASLPEWLAEEAERIFLSTAGDEPQPMFKL